MQTISSGGQCELCERELKKTLANFTVDKMENLQIKHEMCLSKYKTKIWPQNPSKCIPFEVE